MSDNGARALAERLAAIWPTSTWGTGSAPPSPTDHSYEVPDPFIVGPPDRLAAAILANGAVFLPDAAELDRLRRIEAAARAFTTDDCTWDHEAQGGDPGPVLRRLLQPKGSARDDVAEYRRAQQRGSAGTHGDTCANHDESLDAAYRKGVADGRATEGSARDGG